MSTVDITQLRVMYGPGGARHAAVEALLDKFAAAEARIAELERDAVDKACAWDAIAQKNARIAELEAALKRLVYEVEESADENGPGSFGWDDALHAAHAALGDK